MDEISFEEWKRMKFKVGRILSAERMPRTEKLYRLQVDVGGERPLRIISSLVPYYSKDELKDKNIVVFTNLKPTKFSGEVSEGMLLCAEKEDGSECVLLTVEKEIAPGTPIT